VKSEVSTLESNKVKLSVEVDESEIDAHIDEAFKKIAKEIRLPGFRPGKAPRKVLEARIGKDYARGEALREALPEYYRLAIIEHEVDVIAPPELDITDGEEEGPVAFEAVVEVRPHVTVAGYDGLQIELPAPGATAEEIDAQLDSLRKQFAERVDVDRAAADGDYVTMDIGATHDGEPVEGLTAEDYSYELGAGFVVDELDGELRDAEAGAHIEFEADHPDPDEDGRLTFVVDVKAVQEDQLPELDDAFATEATEFETADELVADTRQRIDTMKRSQAEMLIADKTGEALAALVADDIPDSLVEDQMQHQLQDMSMRLAQQGIQLEQFLQMTGQDAEALRENMREPAEQAARVDLALRGVAAAEGMEITDDEIQAEIDDSASQMDQDAAEMREAFEEAGQIPLLRADMLKRKAMDMLVESVAIVDEDGNTIDRADLEPLEVDEADESTAADAEDVEQSDSAESDTASADVGDTDEGDE
jgi:trigger factor